MDVANERRVIISAGHHPAAPGCQYYGLSEHNEAYKVVFHLAQALRQRGLEPITIAGTLTQKTRLANESPAICAVEVHFNADKDSHVGGTETLFGKNPLDRQLAELIQAKLVARLGLRDRGVKFSDYAGTPELDECAWTREINAPAAIVNRYSSRTSPRHRACRGHTRNIA